MGDPKELAMKYGGVAGLAVSALLLLAYLGMMMTQEGHDKKFDQLSKLDEDIRGVLRTKEFTPENAPPQIPDYTSEVAKSWEKANIAQLTPNFFVYPVLGVMFEEFKDKPSDFEKLKSALKGRYLVLEKGTPYFGDPKSTIKYFGPTAVITRGEPKNLRKATPANITRVEQENLDRILIEWEDTDASMIASTKLDEYQLYRIEEGNPGEPTRVTPSGYKEKTFVDTNFNPRTSYKYFVVTRVMEVSLAEPPLSKEAKSGVSSAIKTISDTGIIFNAVIGGGAASFANVDVYKYYQGEWVKAGFQVKRGDLIGKPKKVKVKDARVDIDFSTNCEVYEYYEDEERTVQLEGGKEVSLPRQARLIYFDGNENKKRKELWKFNPTYDKNPYEEKK